MEDSDANISGSHISFESAEKGDNLDKDIPRGLSTGINENFWNTDVVDEQLFEFLAFPFPKKSH